MKLLTTHLFMVTEILDKIGVGDEIMKGATTVNTKGMKKAELDLLQQQLGMKIIFSIIGKMRKAETEICELLALVYEKEVEEIKNQDGSITVEMIKEIVGSETFKGFFNTMYK